jgi:hypothetical protein
MMSALVSQFADLRSQTDIVDFHLKEVAVD